MKNKEFKKTKGIKPVGYTELVRRYSLNVIPHYTQSFIAETGRRRSVIDGHRKTEIYTRKYDPGT